MRAESRTVKLRATITTVDPKQRIIQAQTVDGPCTITLIEVPSGFVWPREGEQWSIYKENQTWILGSRLQQNTDPRRVEDLLPGQTLSPDYYEERLATGTLYKVIRHNLGSKALSVRTRTAQTGYQLVLDSEITSSMTMLVANEPSSGQEVRHTGSGFMIIEDEIVRYTSSSIGSPTAVFSGLTRGQLGTSASSHPEGSEITLFSYSSAAVPPGHEITPIDNNRALIKFTTTTSFPVDIAIIG